MRYFIDTEFIEDGKTIDLISIGIVNEVGESYYAISSEADYGKAYDNEWVRNNVLTQLPGMFLRDTALLGPDNAADSETWLMSADHSDIKRRNKIANEIVAFIDVSETPEFWAYYSSYDWVVLCQLFGAMMDLPHGWPMFCMDIKQLAMMLGNPRLPEQGHGVHNALADARWNAEAYKFLAEHFHENDWINL